MNLNWLAYDYHPYDGYGRFGRYMVQALLKLGADVTPLVRSQQHMPDWMQQHVGVGWDRLTIACLPPYMLLPARGRTWVFSMTEGSDLPDGWGRRINEVAERLLVPCAQNADAFRKGGVTVPVHVVPGGTCPEEFPLLGLSRNGHHGAYTFLAMADRGARKGWVETYSAFFKVFGDTSDVRLLIKTRGDPNDTVQRIMEANLDPRIEFWSENVDDMADVYARADCAVMPSRSEGWGMPQREAAMMGLPVIATRYAGLDDGHTDAWALPVESMRPDPIPPYLSSHLAGHWMRPDVDEIGRLMRWCYENRGEAAVCGRQAAQWLRANQTWQHAATRLLEVVETYG